MWILAIQKQFMINFKVAKPIFPHLSLAVMIFAGTMISNPCYSSDISQSVRNNVQQVNDSEDYLEIGIMYRTTDEPTFLGKSHYSNTSLFINGSYSWNDLFVESYSESGHGVVFGYNAFSNKDWSLDFIATTDWGQASFENDGRYNDDSALTIGSRLSGYLGNNTVQFAVNQDATGDHNGTTVSALIGRNWQLRNWNFHGIVGAEYSSSKLNDYYAGVSKEQAEYLTSFGRDFDAYDPGDSVTFSTEFGVTYPIAEDWVFRATARAVTRPDAITDSPRYPKMDSLATSFRTSISYVF